MSTINKGDWRAYIERLDKCAAEHGGCENCPVIRRQICEQEYEKINNNVDYRPPIQETEGKGKVNNPMVEGQGFVDHRSAPLSILNCVGFAAQGIGSKKRIPDKL